MAVYKRGKIWWYEFLFDGERVRKSTKQGNKRVAEQMEAADRTRRAKGEVGIVERKFAPTLKAFAPRFEKAIETLCADKPRTVAFYKERMGRLLSFGPLASVSLDAIDEELIDTLKQARSREISRRGKPLSVASINRELATLRRLLRLAHEWKIIDRVPRVRLLRGERVREFVLSHQQEDVYLEMAPQPLKDIATLILDMGLRPGEAANLEFSEIRMEPAHNSQFGYVHVRGLNSQGKSTYSDRNLSLSSERVVEMLEARRAAFMNKYVFPDENGGPVLVSTVDHQHAELRRKLKLPEDCVVHSLRHTMLTRLGESGADAFTIMRIAGHSSVTVSQRYVHPSPETLERAFERYEALNKSRRGRSGPPTISTTPTENGAQRNPVNSLI